MKVRFHGPFAALAEPEAQVALERPVPLRELLGLLAVRYAGMARYAGIGSEAELSCQLVFIRAGRILDWSETVRDTDLIEVVLPATGG